MLGAKVSSAADGDQRQGAGPKLERAHDVFLASDAPWSSARLVLRRRAAPPLRTGQRYTGHIRVFLRSSGLDRFLILHVGAVAKGYVKWAGGGDGHGLVAIALHRTAPLRQLNRHHIHPHCVIRPVGYQGEALMRHLSVSRRWIPGEGRRSAATMEREV